MINSEILVERHSYTHYDPNHPRGSGYCLDQGQYYILVKRWKLGKITIWKSILDREEIPNHVWITWGALGFDDGSWKSKFADQLEMQRKAQNGNS